MDNVAIVNNKIDKESLKGFDYIVAIEEGYKYLKDINVEADIVIGDFDSFDIKKVDHKNIVFKEDQNYSDLELAIKYIKGNNEEAKITCFQFEGKRHSHLISQIRLVIKYDIKMIFNNSKIIKLSKTNTIPKTDYYYISFFSISDNRINIENAKYEMKNTEVKFDDPSTYLSNEWDKDKEMKVTFKEEPSCVAILELKEK